MSPSLPSLSPSPLTISSPSASSPVTILSKSTVFPNQKSQPLEFKLSVSDLPMLSCHYIQKGLLFPPPTIPIDPLISLLSTALSRALSSFPPLAGRLITDAGGRIFVSCSDAGAEFSHASAPCLTIPFLIPPSSDVPVQVKYLFPLEAAVSHDGHFLPLSSFQLTELGDGAVFLACAINHAGPSVTFPVDAPLRERIFHFRREAIRELKSKANDFLNEEISSFQSLCAQVWISVTRARKNLQASMPTTFRMAVNCRRRVVPPVDEYYFGNAIQSIPTTAAVEEVAAGELPKISRMLSGNVAAHGDKMIRESVSEWEAAPSCFPLGNPGGAGLTMGSSPRFPMYERNDFGWGGPTAVRSGMANKFDGKISAFPGREGGGSVDLEVCLSPETMAELLLEKEFMYFVSEEETAVSAVAAK
ncbi:hypothetical protein KSP40_PGU008384 [Platanthera guangdongensis]|uniref:BAHD acyltransferase DCR n=1 Tax=Platanthera guangdongensis TaxID=2320717 RepID=A0ABR2LTG8_9ASPA